LTAGDLARWDSLYRAGVALESRGDGPAAMEQYEAAAGIDDRHAALQFRLGRCLAAAGRVADAHRRFVLACDLDALRFRADSRINAIIREVAAARESEGVYFVDGERALAGDAPAAGRIPGGDLFHDHVHLNFAGNYRLASAVLDQVSKALPEGIRLRQRGSVPQQAACAEQLGLTSWDEFQMAARAAKSTSRAPFSDQMDHALRQAAARQRVEHLGRIASAPTALAEAVKTYEAALAARPDDWQLHDKLAAILHLQGEAQEAIAHWRESLRLLPNNIETLNRLAAVLATSPAASLRNGREAIELARRAVTLSAGQEPLFLDTLAAAYAESGQFAKAVETAEHALVLADRQHKTALADALRERISGYRVGVKFQPPRHEAFAPRTVSGL
jgi:tetratricopeptide (TPR) repeat protein